MSNRPSRAPLRRACHNALDLPGPQGGAGDQSPGSHAVPTATAGESATGPVQDYLATVSGTGTKTNTPLNQTAQSISVVRRARS